MFTWQKPGLITAFLKPSSYTGWAPFSGKEPGANGLARDAEGRLVLCQYGDWRVIRIELWARPGGISIFAPDGTHLGSIETGQPTSNLAWGDDGATLYITGGSSLYRIRLPVRGARFS